MKQILLVGLGNVGRAYEHTRHNLGIRALRAWVHAQKETGVQTEWAEKESWMSEVAQWSAPDTAFHAMFPLTNMNNSGAAVAAVVKKYSIPHEHIFVVHDELELPLGEMKIKEGGSASGHNGVKSIHEHLGAQDVTRLRLGVGRPAEGEPVTQYVLSKFSSEEERMVQEEVIPRAVEMITEYADSI